MNDSHHCRLPPSPPRSPSRHCRAAADRPAAHRGSRAKAKARWRPDLATLSLAVMREAPTAREALDANNAAMAAVIAAMKASGVEDRDLQTAGIQISPRYDYTNKPDGTQEARLAAYQVTNTLSVRVRDLASTGEIIDKAVSLGVNQGGGITFANADPSAGAHRGAQARGRRRDGQGQDAGRGRRRVARPR